MHYFVLRVAIPPSFSVSLSPSLFSLCFTFHTECIRYDLKCLFRYHLFCRSLASPHPLTALRSSIIFGSFSLPRPTLYSLFTTASSHYTHPVSSLRTISIVALIPHTRVLFIPHTTYIRTHTSVSSLQTFISSNLHCTLFAVCRFVCSDLCIHSLTPITTRCISLLLFRSSLISLVLLVEKTHLCPASDPLRRSVVCAEFSN